MKDKKLKIAIYSRKSKFTEKGDSIENQIEMCKNYISMNFGNENNYTLSIFEDEGFSGKSLKRPEFQKMMKEEKILPFDYIVVYRLDRISRNVADFTNLIEELTKYKTSFICIKEQFDTSTPMGRAMMNIAIVFAQLERETIAERVKDNMYMMGKEGKWTGGTTPLGYKSIKHTEFDIMGKQRTYYTLDFDNEQIELVKLIFKKYNELRSVNGVERYLREHGYLTQKGTQWDNNNLKRILTNPIYCIADENSYKYFSELGCNVCFDLDDCNGEYGILPYNRYAGTKRENTNIKEWVIAISKHKGLLSGKEWIKIQEIIKENRTLYFGGKPVKRRTLNKNALLSGILFCKCGAYMRPKTYKSGNVFYVCESKDKFGKKECNSENVSAKDLDKIILDELLSFEIKDNNINRQIQNLKKEIEDIDKNTNEKYKILTKQKEQNELSISNLIKALSMNVTPEVISAINKQISDLTKQNTMIEKDIQNLLNDNMKKYEYNLDLKNIEDALICIKDNFDNLSIEIRRDLIKKIIDKVIWDKDTAHIFIQGNIAE